VGSIPWWERLAFGLPGRPYAVPGLAAIGMALVVALLDEAFGTEHTRDVRGLVTPLFVANAVWGTAYVMSGALRTVVDLEPWLRDGAAATRELQSRLLRVSGKTAIMATLVGPLVMVPLRGLRHGGPIDFFREDPTNFVITIVIWIFLGPVVFHSALIVRALLAAGRRIRVDLFTLDALSSFGRVGLRFVLTVGFGATLIGMQAWTAESPGGAAFSGGLFVFWLLLCAVFLLIPSWTVRAAIRAEKNAELEAIEHALRGDRAAAMGLAVAQLGAVPTGVDLLVYRDWVRGLSDWPINSPTLRRFAL
jgi:hypothetical protein